MKSICKYCAFCKPLTETSAECCFKFLEHRAIKPTKASCIQYRPRTILEADSRFLAICYVCYCMGHLSYAPSECDMFIHEHIQDPGVQAAIPFLQLWKDLLAFIQENKKGDKA